MHAGLMYTIFNQILELLLIFDMIVNVLRSYYNEQGVLVYEMKAIRIKYFSSYFLIDLVAAIPFQILVQVWCSDPRETVGIDISVAYSTGGCCACTGHVVARKCAHHSMRY